MSTAESFADAVRSLAPSLFAGIVVVAGMFMLYDLIIRGLVSADAGLAIIGSVLGAAVALLFNNRTIQDTAKVVTNGAATAAVKRAREAETASTETPS